MKIKLLIILLLIFAKGFSQNLVNNSGFENYRSCPDGGNEMNLCDGWSNCDGQYVTYNCGSPDYFNTCGSGNFQLPNTYFATVYAHSGNGIADYTTYNTEIVNYREYLETFLTMPMVIGRTYLVSFYMTTGTDQHFDYHTNNEGVLFSTDSLVYCENTITWRTPQYNNTSVFDSTDWQLFSFHFTADSAYKYIILGDFYLDSQSKIVKANNTGGGYSQIFVDDVSAIVSNAFDTTICQGNSVTLHAHYFSSYAWSTTNNASVFSTDSVITVTPIINTVYLVSGNGITDTAKVFVNPVPLVTVEPQDQFVCSGQSLELMASGASTYVWSPEQSLNTTTGDSVTATPLIQTTYTAVGTDADGCSATGTDVVSINLGLNTPVITQRGDTLFSSATQGNQWVRNDTVLTGATNVFYIITISGWYKVLAINPANGCSTASDSSYLTPSGINRLSINSDQLSVYPNPTNGGIILNINPSAEGVNSWSLQITDVLGRPVYDKQSLNYNNTIDLSNLAGGVYFITVLNETGRAVITVLRQ